MNAVTQHDSGLLVSVTPIRSRNLANFVRLFDVTYRHLQNPVISTYWIRRGNPVFEPLSNFTTEDDVLCVNIYAEDAHQLCIDSWFNYTFFTETSADRFSKRSIFSIGCTRSGRTSWINIPIDNITEFFWKSRNKETINILLIGGHGIALYKFRFTKDKKREYSDAFVEANRYQPYSTLSADELEAAFSHKRFLPREFKSLLTPFFDFKWDELEFLNDELCVAPYTYEINDNVTERPCRDFIASFSQLHDYIGVPWGAL